MLLMLVLGLQLGLGLGLVLKPALKRGLGGEGGGEALGSLLCSSVLSHPPKFTFANPGQPQSLKTILHETIPEEARKRYFPGVNTVRHGGTSIMNAGLQLLCPSCRYCLLGRICRTNSMQRAI